MSFNWAFLRLLYDIQTSKEVIFFAHTRQKMDSNTSKKRRQPLDAAQANHNTRRKAASAILSTIAVPGLTASSRDLGSSTVNPLLIASHGHEIPSSPSDDHVDDCAVAVEMEGIDMALELKVNGTIGCAYFETASSTLYIYEDMRNANLEIISSVLFQIQPTCVFVPSRSPDELMVLLDRLSHWTGNGPVEEARKFDLRSVVSSDFNADYGRQVLARPDGMTFSCDPSALFTTAPILAEGHAHDDNINPQSGVRISEQNKLMLLGTLVDLNNQVSVCVKPTATQTGVLSIALSPSSECI